FSIPRKRCIRDDDMTSRVDVEQPERPGARQACRRTGQPWPFRCCDHTIHVRRVSLFHISARSRHACPARRVQESIDTEEAESTERFADLFSVSSCWLCEL